MLARSKWKAFGDNKLKVAQLLPDGVKNNVDEDWLTAFSSFVTLLSKSFFSRVVENGLFGKV